MIEKLGPTGPDTVKSADDRFARCANGADQYIAEIIGGRVRAILRQYCGSPPDQQLRIAEARAFFPPDANQKGTPFTTEQGEQAWSYVSKQLASAFEASWFQDCHDLILPGTFSLTIDKGGWVLGAGTCP